MASTREAPGISATDSRPAREKGEIHEHHEQLLESVEDLESRMAAAGADPVRDAPLVSDLVRLAASLHEHFAFEESANFFGKALLAAPRLSRRARELAAQHAELEAGLAVVVEDARSCAGDRRGWAPLRRDFEAFAEVLRAHERAENALLMDAYLDDLGGGD